MKGNFRKSHLFGQDLGGIRRKGVSDPTLKDFDKQGEGILGERISVSREPQIVKSASSCRKTRLSGACY